MGKNMNSLNLSCLYHMNLEKKFGIVISLFYLYMQCLDNYGEPSD